MRVVVKYLRENPETLHHWRQLVALRALQHAFPCGSTTTPSPQPTPAGRQPPTPPKPSKGR
jgi:hypothetical protein